MERPNQFFSKLLTLFVAVTLLVACSPASTPTPAEPAAEQPTEQSAAPAETVKIGLFLPDKKTARWDSKDRPFFEAKLEEICPDCEFIYNNVDADATEQLTAVQTAITNGANVVAVSSVDSKAAAAIADYAKAAGVPVIAYSRPIENSDGVTVSVGFQLADIGRAQAQELIDHLTEQGVTNPQIVMINGGPSDANMPIIKDGAMEVFQPLVDSGKLNILRSVDTPDWDPTQAQDEMQQILTALADTKIDGVYVMNDGMAGGVVAALKTAGVDPLPPVTGLDCELAAVQRIVAGEQLMCVYLPIKALADASAQMAYDLATKGEVSADMLQGTMNNGVMDVPAAFIPVVSVDASNIKETLIAEGFWTLEDICTPEFAEACTSVGLE
jgi:D-xylose transport system substrate-binding protein